MKKALFILLILAGALLASCGGSPGTKVTVSIKNEAGQDTLPLSVAYQVGDGDWAWLRPGEDAGYGFSVPAGSKRYGVAVKCPGLGAAAMGGGRAVIYLLDVDETTNPVFTCQDNHAGVHIDVNFDASAVTGANSIKYFYQRRSRWRSHATSSHPEGAYLDPQDDADLLFAAYSTSSGSPKPNDMLAARLLRGVDFEEGLELDLTLSNTDAVSPANVQPLPLPSGWQGGYSVGLISKGGVIARGALGAGDETGGIYNRVGNVSAGDLYAFKSRGSYTLANHKRLLLQEVRFFNAVGAGDLEARFPEAFPEDYQPTDDAGFWRFALDYQGEAAGYIFGVLRGCDSQQKVWASAAWLEGSSGYTMPDLSDVIGFDGFDSSNDWSVCAIVSDVPLAELLTTPKGTQEQVPSLLQRPLEIGFSCLDYFN